MKTLLVHSKMSQYEQRYRRSAILTAFSFALPSTVTEVGASLIRENWNPRRIRNETNFVLSRIVRPRTIPIQLLGCDYSDTKTNCSANGAFRSVKQLTPIEFLQLQQLQVSELRAFHVDVEANLFSVSEQLIERGLINVDRIKLLRHSVLKTQHLLPGTVINKGVIVGWST